MKSILIISMLLSAIFSYGQSMHNSPELDRQLREKKEHPPLRYFLVGYIANQGNKIFDGGIDTVMIKYPKCRDLVIWLSKKYGLTDLRILSIIEQTKEEHEEFWKGMPK